MNPTLSTRTGIHMLYFRVSMASYDGYIDIPFQVTVVDCVPAIDSSNVVIPTSFTQPWGADAAILPT